MLHFWSLAVEEQFYLLWPLALGGAFAFTRRWDRERQMRAIRIAVAVGAVASVVWALSLRTTDPNRAYYGADTRAYELLAGALIALVPDMVVAAAALRRSMRAATVLGTAALLLLASSWVHLDAIERGVAVTITTGVLIVALEVVGGRCRETSAVAPGRRVSRQDLVRDVSLALAGDPGGHPDVPRQHDRHHRDRRPRRDGVGVVELRAAGGTGANIAGARPVSTGRDRAGLAISVLSALVLIPRIVDPAQAATPVARGSTIVGFTPVTASVDWRDAKKGGGPFVTCLQKPAAVCTVVHGTGPSILLMGDSHAWMLIPAFTEIARRNNLTLSVSVAGHCPWQQDLYVVPITVNGLTATTESCQAQKDDTYARVIPALHPDVIVVMNVTHDLPGPTPFLGADGKVVPNGSPASMRWVETTTVRRSALRADGRKVLIIEPIPVAPFNTLTCLSAAKVLEQCRFVANAKPDWLENFYRQHARQDHDVFSADFDRLVCPYLPICDPVVNGQVVRRDGDHVTAKFAKSLAPQIGAYLRSTGLISR